MTLQKEWEEAAVYRKRRAGACSHLFIYSIDLLINNTDFLTSQKKKFKKDPPLWIKSLKVEMKSLSL